ncbi:MAG: hypothetical protein LBU53_10480 [Zoogloeaceae bacterium]|nr:hypothetical protein [Zoogloeaceae bacterium]
MPDAVCVLREREKSRRGGVMEWLFALFVYGAIGFIFLVLMWLSPVWFVAMCILAIAKVPGYLRDWARTNLLATVIVVLWLGLFYGFETGFILMAMVFIGVLSIPVLCVYFFTRNICLGTIKVVCSLAFTVIITVVFYYANSARLENQKRINKEEAAIPSLARASRDYFDEQCKKSGYFVYKEIEKPQKSVAILLDKNYFLDRELYEAQRSAREVQGRYVDYFKMSMDDSYKEEVERLFWHKNNLPSFLFVELVQYQNSKVIHSTVIHFTPETMKSGQHLVTTVPQSRYGYVWQDVTTVEDIEHWVTKNKLKVIDMKTDEVVAERIVYTLSSYPGTTSSYVREKAESRSYNHFRSGEPVFCPYNMKEVDAEWIKSLLLGTSFW